MGARLRLSPPTLLPLTSAGALVWTMGVFCLLGQRQGLCPTVPATGYSGLTLVADAPRSPQIWVPLSLTCCRCDKVRSCTLGSVLWKRVISPLWMCLLQLCGPHPPPCLPTSGQSRLAWASYNPGVLLCPARPPGGTSSGDMAGRNLGVGLRRTDSCVEWRPLGAQTLQRCCSQILVSARLQPLRAARPPQRPACLESLRARAASEAQDLSWSNAGTAAELAPCPPASSRLGGRCCQRPAPPPPADQRPLFLPPGSPADNAALRSGDRILFLNGLDMRSEAAGDSRAWQRTVPQNCRLSGPPALVLISSAQWVPRVCPSS